MKKITAVILMCIILATGLMSYAEETCNVTVNGVYVEFDQPPVVLDGRTLIPIRAVAEKIGATVKYNETTYITSIIYKNIGIALRVGDPDITVGDTLTNTQKTVKLEIPAQEIGNRTLVPLRAIVEEFGCKVGWDEASSTVSVTTPDYIEKKSQKAIIIGE